MLDARCDKMVGPFLFLSRGEWAKIRTRRRLLRRIRPHLKEEAMIRPQATVRRVGRRPTANSKSEFRNLGPGGWIEYPVSSPSVGWAGGLDFLRRQPIEPKRRVNTHEVPAGEDHYQHCAEGHGCSDHEHDDNLVGHGLQGW